MTTNVCGVAAVMRSTLRSAEDRIATAFGPPWTVGVPPAETVPGDVGVGVGVGVCKSVGVGDGGWLGFP